MPSAPAALPPGAVVGSGLAVPVRASCTACTAARRRCDPSPIPGAACLRCERNGLPAEGCVFLPPKRRGRRPGKRRGAKKEDSESPASPASPSSPPAAEIAAPSPPPPPAWATPMLAQALAWPAEFGAPNPAWPQPVSPPLPLSPPSSVDLELAPPDLVMSRYLASTYAALPLTVAAELRRELAARAVPDFLAWSILLWTAWTDGPLRAALGSRRGPLLTVMAARAQDALLPAAQAVLAGPPAAPPIPGVGEPAWIAPPAVRAWLSYRELAVAVVSALLHLGGVAMALRGDGPLASGPVVALAVRIARVACMTDGSFYAGRTDVVAERAARAWWSLAIFDAQAAAIDGRPPLLHQEESRWVPVQRTDAEFAAAMTRVARDLPLDAAGAELRAPPSPLESSLGPDEDFSPTHHHVRVFLLFSRCAAAGADRAPLLADRAPLLAALDAWYAELPPPGLLVDNGTPPPELRGAPLALTAYTLLVHHGARILLLLPSAPADPGFLALHAHALAATRLIPMLPPEVLAKPFAQHCLLLAASAHAGYLRAAGGRGGREADEARVMLAMHRRALEEGVGAGGAWEARWEAACGGV